MTDPAGSPAKPRATPRLRAAVVAAALGLGTVFAPAAFAQTVKVGFISTFSGPNASLGDTMDKAVQLYLKLHGQELSPIQVDVIRRDDGGANPDNAKRLAQELIVRDHVSFLTGFVFTPNVAAVAPLSREAKVPMVLMNTGTSGLLDLSPYMVRFSFNTWQIGYTLGQWAAKNGVKTATVAISDFSGGIDYGNAFSRGFTEAGGRVVETIKMPISNPDFSPIVQRIRDSHPEAVFVFNLGGGQATSFLKAFHELGLDKAGIRLLATGDLTPDDELKNMTDIDFPAISAHHYTAFATRPANQEFVAAWKQAYGADSTPNFISAAAWEATRAICEAIKQEGGKMDPDRTMAILRNYKDDNSIRGPLHIDPNTRDVVQNVYIRRLQRINGQLTDQEFDTVPQVGNPQAAPAAQK